MSSLIISLLAVVIISSICSLFCHLFIKHDRAANIAAILYALLIFHGLAYIEAGYLDPYWFISSLIVMGITLPISMLIGTIIQQRRRVKHATANHISKH